MRLRGFFFGPRKNSFRRIWLKLSLISILSVLVPTIVLGFWFASTWRERQIEVFIREQTGKIRDISQTVQSNFQMVENDISIAKTDNVFYSYKRMEAAGQNVENLLALHQQLENFSVKYSFVQSAHFYDPRDDVIVTNSGVYDREGYYDTDWLGALQGGVHQTQRLPARMNVNAAVWNDEYSRRILQYRPERVLTIAGTGPRSIVIALNISVSGLYDYLDQIYSFEEYDFFLADRTGRVLSPQRGGSGEALPFSLEEAVDSYCQTADSLYFVKSMGAEGLYCVTRYPIDSVNASYYSFQLFLFLICALIALVMAAMSVILTRQVYSPVQDVLASVRELSVAKGDEGRIGDEISYIKSAYNQLEASRKTLQDALAVQERASRSYQLKAYLDGLIPLEQLAEGEAVPGEVCRLAVIALPRACREGLSPSSRFHAVEIIDAYVSSGIRGMFFDLDQRSFLACLRAGDADSVDDALKMALRLLEEILETKVRAGAGVAVSDPGEWRAQYEKARLAAQHAVFFGLGGVVSGDSLDAGVSGDMSFLINCETELVRRVIDLQPKEAVRCVEKVTDHLPAGSSVAYVRSIYQRLMTTILKEFPLDGAHRDDPYDQFNRLETLEEVQAFIGRQIHGIVEALEARSDSGGWYCAQAKQFLEDHFNRNISMSDIAEHLGISYPYLSKLFKDTTGVGLLDYLNGLRVERSKEFLAAGGDNIAAIAERVGYNNPQSYQRFFKRIVGLTPGEYRKAFGKRVGETEG